MTTLLKDKNPIKSVNKPRDLFRQMRPTQWAKNIFVFTGVIFGISFDVFPILLATISAAISFCLVSSTIYIVNDILDRESDRHHPKKKNRPIASGAVTVRAGWILACITGICGVAIAAMISNKALIIVLLYVALNTLYSIKLKHIVIMDVFCISSGFMLRILAGTTGVGIPPSKWLVLCGLMITLFLGFAKRRAELVTLQNDDKEKHRHVLKLYKTNFLDNVISICATCTILTYSLYTMSPITVGTHQTDNLIFTVPFVAYALFRYMFNLQHSNSAGDPTTDLVKDKHIIAAVIGWVVSSVFFINYAAMQ